jgi:glycosyltransferase involved in cell wall biosynthesis
LVVIHDAQPFLVPNAYSRVFRTWYRFLLPRLARNAELVVTVSKYSRLQLERFGVVPPGKAHVIPNGADHILRLQEDVDTLSRYRLFRDGYVLALGSLAPHKNIETLVRAFAKRHDSLPELIVAGGTASQVFAGVRIQNSSGIRFLGRITDSELKALYSNALAFAFPSLTEGFGLPPLEAMFCGCPVIASTAGAVEEVCGKAAIYASASDPHEWRIAIERLTRDAALRQQYREVGRMHAAQYTWRKAAERYQRLLSEAACRDGEQ